MAQDNVPIGQGQIPEQYAKLEAMIDLLGAVVLNLIERCKPVTSDSHTAPKPGDSKIETNLCQSAASLRKLSTKVVGIIEQVQATLTNIEL